MKDDKTEFDPPSQDKIKSEARHKEGEENTLEFSFQHEPTLKAPESVVQGNILSDLESLKSSPAPPKKVKKTVKYED